MEVSYDSKLYSAEMIAEIKKRGAMYKLGYVQPYLKRRRGEDNFSELAKKFLKQVRESNGYDVQIRPPQFLQSPFCPFPPNKPTSYGIRIAKAAMELINQQTMKENGKRYELFRIKRFVATAGTPKLLTLRVKDVDDASIKTLRACAIVPKQPKFECSLEEWMFVPDQDDEGEEEEAQDLEESEDSEEEDDHVRHARASKKVHKHKYTEVDYSLK